MQKIYAKAHVSCEQTFPYAFPVLNLYSLLINTLHFFSLLPPPVYLEHRQAVSVTASSQRDAVQHTNYLGFGQKLTCARKVKQV